MEGDQDDSSCSDDDRTLQHREAATAETRSDLQQPENEVQCDHDDSEEEDFASYQAQPMAQVLLDSIVSTVDRLYRVSFRIRNPAMRLGLSKARTHREVDEETNVDLFDRYRQADLHHLQELFSQYHRSSPKDHDGHYLVQRLATANTRRRQQFKYWRKRNAKSKRSNLPMQHRVIHNMPTHRTPQVGETGEVLGMAQPTQSLPSTATRLDATKIDLEDGGSVISTSTYIVTNNEVEGDRVSIAPPPKQLFSAKEFECPYCFTLCPRKLLSEKSWT